MPDPTPPTVPLSGPNILLMGVPGTGKTHAIRTLLDAGLEVGVVSTEPGIGEVLGDTPKDKLHWVEIFPAVPDWSALMDTAKKLNTLSNDSLQKLDGINRDKYFQFGDLLNTFMNFKCERCGKVMGDVSKWNTDRALVLDSLSGLNIMLLDMKVGAKPLKTLPDWGAAMDNEERILAKLTNDTRCTFVMTAHLTREQDEVMGGLKLGVAALGAKLGPKIPRFFSDAILCTREGGKWTWDTADGRADVKARNLDWKSGQPPTFVPLIERWKKIGCLNQPSTKPYPFPVYHPGPARHEHPPDPRRRVPRGHHQDRSPFR